MHRVKLIIGLIVMTVVLGIVAGLVMIMLKSDGVAPDDNAGDAGKTTATGGAITSFEQCAARGYPVMESYPRRCIADGQEFVEVVGGTDVVEPPAGGSGESELEELAPDLRLKTPHSYDTVKFPLVIEGETAGWYFEGDFPI